MRIHATHIMAVLLAATTALFGACSNGAPPRETVRVDLRALQLQVGVAAGAAGIDVPQDSAATDQIKTIVVGPLTYRTYGKPYSLENDAWTDDINDKFTDDISNTGNLLLFIQIPTTKEYAEFDVPQVSSGWQVIAAAATSVLKTPDDLQKDENKNSLAYYGVTEQAFTGAADLNSRDVTLTMQRACLVKAPFTPKGCATYNKYKEASVTAAVEILGVRINVRGLDDGDSVMDDIMSQPSVTWTFPMIVRNPAAEGEVTPEEAMNRLNTVKLMIDDRLASIPTGTISRLTVFTSHRENPTEKAACKQLTNQDSVATYRANCEVQKYFYAYQ